jgi:hypothetical protein
MVRRQLSALLGNPEAAPAGRENDRARIDHVLAATGAPTVRPRDELGERRLRKDLDLGRLDPLAQRLRDRVAGAVAHLEQSLLRRTAAAGEPVAAVFARELDAVLLEPVDRGRCLAGQHLDEPAVGGLVRALPDVLGVLLRRIVFTEGGLDPALGLRGVARLDRVLRDERHSGSGALGRDGCGKAGSAAADHEHVEFDRGGHDGRLYHP